MGIGGNADGRKGELAASSLAPGLRSVNVERRGAACVIIPSCQDALAPLFTEGICYRAIPGQAGRAIRDPETLYLIGFDRIDGDHAVLPIGLERIALHLLRQAGYRVNHSDETLLAPKAMSAPDLAAASRIGPVDESILNLVHDRDRGLVRFKPGAVLPARMIAQVALAYPSMRIGVVAKSRAGVRRAGRDLDHFLPGQVDVVDGPCPRRLGWVVVATYAGLADPAVEVEKLDILFALDAAEALEANARRSIPHAERARLYGFLGIDEHLAPYDRDWVAAVFGLDEVVIPRHSQVAEPVEVVGARFAGGPALATGLDVIGIKRAGIWRHGLRNRWVAALAVAIASGDRPAVGSKSSAVAARLGDAAGSPRVAVLVENLEHALALADRLAGWLIAAGPHVTSSGLPDRLAGILSSRRWGGTGLPPNAIVTFAGLEAAGLDDIDVLVRADGGRDVPPALGRGSIRGYGDASPLLVVDVQDRHHPMLRDWARSRSAACRDRGWATGDGEPPDPIGRFLASRPGRSR